MVTVRVGVATEAAVAATAEEVGGGGRGGMVKVGVAVKAVAATEIAGEVRSGMRSAQTTQNIARVPLLGALTNVPSTM